MVERQTEYAELHNLLDIVISVAPVHEDLAA